MNIKNKLLVLAGLDPMEDPAASPIEAPSVTQPVQDDSGDHPMNGTPDSANQEDNTGKFWLVMPPNLSGTEQPPPGGSEPPKPMGPMGQEPVPSMTNQPETSQGEGSLLPREPISLVTVQELVKIIRELPPEHDNSIQLFSFDDKEQASIAASQLGSNDQPENSSDNGGGVTDTMKFMNKPKMLTQNPVSTEPGATESIITEKIIPANKVPVDIVDLTNKNHDNAASNDKIKYPDDGKVKIPPNVKTSVKQSIKRAAEDLEKAQARATLDNRAGNLRPQQPADVDFYIDLLNAYQKIDTLLQDDTEESIKRLQLFIPSLPNWMKKEFPVELVKFAAYGGRPLAVKDHLAAIKAFKSKGM